MASLKLGATIPNYVSFWYAEAWVHVLFSILYSKGLSNGKLST